MLNFGIGQLSRSIVIYFICLFLCVCESVWFVVSGSESTEPVTRWWACLWERWAALRVTHGGVGSASLASRGSRSSSQPMAAARWPSASRALRKKRVGWSACFHSAPASSGQASLVQTPLFSHTVVCFKGVGEQTWDAAAAWSGSRVSPFSLSLSLSLCLSLPLHELVNDGAPRALPPRAKTHMAAGGALNQQSI